MSEQSTSSSRLSKGWSSPIRGDGILWWNEEGVPQWELLGKPTGMAPSWTQRKHHPSERVWNLSAEDTYLEEKVRAHVCLSDQGKTLPAWECSGSSSQCSPDLAPSHGHRVCLSEFVSGEKCPFLGRLPRPLGRILFSEREQCCGRMEW